MQVIDKSYWMSANNNVLRRKMIYPSRGVIYDRNGKVLVRNTSVYDLMVVPREIKGIDTALLCQLIDIDVEGYHTRVAQAQKFSSYRASIFEKQLSVKTYAKLQEHLYELRGFYVRVYCAQQAPYTRLSIHHPGGSK